MEFFVSKNDSPDSFQFFISEKNLLLYPLEIYFNKSFNKKKSYYYLIIDPKNIHFKNLNEVYLKSLERKKLGAEHFEIKEFVLDISKFFIRRFNSKKNLKTWLKKYYDTKNLITDYSTID